MGCSLMYLTLRTCGSDSDAVRTGHAAERAWRRLSPTSPLPTCYAAALLRWRPHLPSPTNNPDRVVRGKRVFLWRVLLYSSH
jgi:hypothetical protein